MHLVGARLEPAEEAADAVPLAFPFAGDVRGVAVLDEPTLRGRQFLPGHVHRDARLAARLGEVALALAVDGPLERRDGAFGQRQRRVGDDLLPVEADDPAEAAAGRTGSDGRVEGEERGRSRAEFPSVHGRLEQLAVARHLVAGFVQDPQAPAAEPERRERGLVEARGFRRGDRDAVLHHQQLGRLGGDRLLAEAPPSTGDVGAVEARLHEFVRHRRPGEVGGLRDGEGQRHRPAGLAGQAIFPGGRGSARRERLAGSRVDELRPVREPHLEPIA